MERARNVKERTKDGKLLRVEKIEAVHPNLRIAQEGRRAELPRETLHPVRLIRIASFHARRKLLHHDRKIRKFLRQTSRRRPIGSRTQYIRMNPIAFELRDCTAQRLGKSALMHGACKGGEIARTLDEDVLEQNAHPDITDARQMRPARLDQHLPCKSAEAKDIRLQKACAARQDLGERALRGVGHMLGHEQNPLSAQRLARERILHRHETGVRLARPRAPDDKL